ncbi:uncharacterized protein [Mytilus edulis]|uniref:uncharacterized protein n=1 Tax=Mytilus edulis TaxID=6550 RepID=UPI0039EF3E86
MMRIIAISIMVCNIRYTFTSSIYRGSKDNIESQIQCSKYHFEEKILEKLVRVEHKLEINEQRIKNFEESVSIKLNDFNESENQWRHSMLSLIQDTFKEENNLINSSVQSLILDTFTDEKNLFNSSVQSFILDTFKEEQHLLNISVQSLILNTFKEEKKLLNKSLVNVIEDVKIKSDNLADKFTAKFNQLRKDHSSPVLFKATSVQSDTNLQGEILIFNTIVTNDGLGCDKNSGIFTAPVSGVYLFTVQICPEIGAHLQVHIVANGDVIGKLHFKNSSDSRDVCVSANGIHKVLKGEKVWIVCSKANSKGDVIYAITANSFSGILLNTN